MALISLNNLERFFNNLKTYISNALSSKANASHTHTTADISNLAENWNVTGTNLDISFAGSSNNNGQLSIQINGTDITTFMANQITNSTFNLNFNSFGYNLIPSVNETYNLGSATNNYNTVYTRNINHGLSSSSLILSGGNGVSNGSNLVLYGIDRTDGFQGIWQLTARGTNSYYLRGNADGSITTSATLIRPTTDNTCDLGSSSVYFKNGYIRNLYTVSADTLTEYQFLPVAAYSDNAAWNSYTQTRCKFKNNEMFAQNRFISENSNSHWLFFVRTPADSNTTDTIIDLAHFGNGERFFAPYYSNIRLGSGGKRWTDIYANNGTIQTSDERQKDNIKQIDDKLLQAWGNVNIVQFNFKDALEKKGENARLHTGYIAQNIQQACKENGINPNDYGLFCHDSWEEQEEKKDENGQVIEPYRAKGDLYSLRYEEALVVECAYLRKQIELLQERLNKLEGK